MRDSWLEAWDLTSLALMQRIGIFDCWTPVYFVTFTFCSFLFFICVCMFLPQCLTRIRLNWKYSPYSNKFKTKSSLWTQLRQIIIIMWLLPSCTLLKILGPLCVEYNISFLNNFPFIKVQLSMIFNHVLFCAIKQSIRSDQQSQTWGFYNHWVSNVLAFSCELRKVSSHSHFSGNF